MNNTGETDILDISSHAVIVLPAPVASAKMPLETDIARSTAFN